MLSLFRASLTVAALVFVVGCAAGDDPADTTEQFFQAMKDNDFEKGKELVTKDSIKDMKEPKDDEKIDMTDLTIGDAKVDGDKATVPTSFKVDGKEVKLDTVLVKEEGAWKIDAGATMSAMVQGMMGDAMKGMGDAMKDAKDAMKGMGEDKK